MTVAGFAPLQAAAEGEQLDTHSKEAAAPEARQKNRRSKAANKKRRKVGSKELIKTSTKEQAEMRQHYEGSPRDLAADFCKEAGLRALFAVFSPRC